MTRVMNAGRVTFAALAVPNYRRYLSGQAISLIGTWMQMTAQSWLVLTLTHSGTWLGLIVALQTLPVLLLGPYGGVIADRVDKRKALFLTQAGFGLNSAVAATLVLSGHANVWTAWAFALAGGCVRVFDNPIRQSFASEMVGPKLVANAVSLNSTVFTSARIIGPSIAGGLISFFGIGWCFVIDACSYAAVITALSLMHPQELFRSTRARSHTSGFRQIIEGLRYAWGDPELRMPLLMMAAVGMLAINFNVLLPLVATRVFHGSAGLYGVLYSMMGIGALCGALYSANRARPTLLLLVGAATAFGACLLLAAGMPILPLEFLVLIPLGAAMTVYQAGTNSSLQLRAKPEFRGRIISLYVLLFNGTTPIGGPIVGWIAQQWGARVGLAVGGTTALLVGAVGFLWLRARRNAARANLTAAS
jgi:MFS family permease